MNILHDVEIEIAIGKYRRDKSWKTKTLLWSEMLDRLCETHRTSETVKEYASLPKERQDEIKDIGGFVGGALAGGRRKGGAVVNRTLVTLDADFATPGLVADIEMNFSFALAVYSTHKHTPGNPRLRVVIPLSREVTVAEYAPISRRLAEMIGIDYFDHTTFQPSRVMYWPSTSKDGHFVFTHNDDPVLDPGVILATYRDWQDSSQWPTCSSEDEAVKRGALKQGDPLTKHGIVGAFCRTYDIREAIETFLPETYAESDVPGRFTYTGGSTSGGLVVYDDVYAYSHHGTDPISGKLCNAFDLVRIHLFGIDDEDVREGTVTHKLPSYEKMVHMAMKDKEVRATLGAERLAEAAADFEGIDVEALEADANEWVERMDVDKNGNPLSTIENMVLVLENDPFLKKRFFFDTFESRITLTGNLPWRKIGDNPSWGKADDSGLRHYMEKVHRLVGREKMDDALEVACLKNSRHPVRDFITGIEWDGVKRVETLFIDYLGAEDSPYIREVSRKTLCAAVARVMEPGCKFEYVLTLVGPEGRKKSTIFSKLAGRWFSDSFDTFEGNKAVEALQGSWIIEIGELKALKKSENETAKHFISKQEDRARLAFWKRVGFMKRQCIFVASTNEDDFLRGYTGNRRFWPVTIDMQPRKKEVFEIDSETAQQVWAEALYLWEKGETLYLDEDMEEEAREIQSEFTQTDERADLIRVYLDRMLPDNWEELSVYERRQWLNSKDEQEINPPVKMRDRVTSIDIWQEALGGDLKTFTRVTGREVAEIMRRVKGWDYNKKARKEEGKYLRGYVRSSKLYHEHIK